VSQSDHSLTADQQRMLRAVARAWWRCWRREAERLPAAGEPDTQAATIVIDGRDARR
jgi:hypothetical protein